MSATGISISKTLKALLLSIVLSFLLAGIFSVFVFFLNISDRAVSTIILLLSALSVFFASFVLAKNADKNGLLNGLVLAGLYFLVLLTLSLLLNGSVGFDLSNLLRLLSVIASGALGGILGINNKK